MIETLQHGWKSPLTNLFRSAESELTIASPYVSRNGARLLIEALSSNFRETGTLNFVSDLSPRNVGQGATDPRSFRALFDSLGSVRLYHLPRLHAKVYVRDNKEAIVTSGNLTDGGVFRNFEYGLRTDDRASVNAIRQDLLDYAALGASIDQKCIEEFCVASVQLRALYLQKERASTSELETKLEKMLGIANDKLIASHLEGKSLNAIFTRTILYLLEKHGELETSELHALLKEIHPDLCDDTVERIINGESFGKKWKHSVRSAQWGLKYQGAIDKSGKKWSVVNSSARSYWLKQVGTSTRRIHDNWTLAGSEGRMHFSKRPRGITEGDLLLVFAVGTKKLVSVYRVTSMALECTDADFLVRPWNRRWPWYVKADVQTPEFERNWADRNLTYEGLSAAFLSANPNGKITPTGASLSGSLLRGRDKLKLAPEFGRFVVDNVSS